MTGIDPVTWNSGTMRMNDGRVVGVADVPRRRRSTAARQA
jgi:hypothetical protein